MNAPFRKPWTQDEFLEWASTQEGRHEFDGIQPVAMVGSTLNHAIITRNLHRALDTRLRGGPCQLLGQDAGLATGAAIRFPDALVTCAKLDGTARVAPDPIVVFEVLSPSSGRTDRIIKVREYAAVTSVRRYAILESSSAGLTVFYRHAGDDVWRSTTLTENDVLDMPEIGIDVPIAEFYEGVEVPQ